MKKFIFIIKNFFFFNYIKIIEQKNFYINDFETSEKFEYLNESANFSKFDSLNKEIYLKNLNVQNKQKFSMYVEDSKYLSFCDDFIKDKEFNYERFDLEQQQKIFDYITNLEDFEQKQIRDLIDNFGLEGKRSVLTVCFFLMQIPNICFYKRNKYLEYTKLKLRLYFFYDSGRYNQRDLFDNLGILKNLNSLDDFKNFENFVQQMKKISEHLKTLNKKEFENFDFDKHSRYYIHFIFLKQKLSHLTKKEISDYLYYFMNINFIEYFQDLLKFKFFFENNFIKILKGQNEIFFFFENLIKQNDNYLNFEVNYVDSENKGYLIKNIFDVKVFLMYLKTSKQNDLKDLELKIIFIEI